MTKQDIVDQILHGRDKAPTSRAEAFASTNIALCKYWGKRNTELNLPINSSLSVSLGPLGTHTVLSLSTDVDEVYFNGQKQDTKSVVYQRIHSFLSLFREKEDVYYTVETSNNIAASAGIASSASGFAALTLCLDKLYSWNLDKKSLSMLARLGSGSACRSIFPGFVEWHAGTSDNGIDSFGVSLPEEWPDLRVGLITVSEDKKPISSREAMAQTVKTSSLYQSWPEKAKRDLIDIKTAIAQKDFELLGRTSERNALDMHATMLGSWPPIFYWLPTTVEIIHKVWKYRSEGLCVFFTMDAGPNIKLIFEKKDQDVITGYFPDITIIAPFG